MWFLLPSIYDGPAEGLSFQERNRGSSDFKGCVAGGHTCHPEKVF